MKRTLALTARQETAMRLLETGATNREIAAELQMNYHTFKNMMSVIYDKLGARQRTEAVWLWRQRQKGE